MRVKLEPETAFVGKKFAYIFFGVIFSLNLLILTWFFYSPNWNKNNLKLVKNKNLFLINWLQNFFKKPCRLKLQKLKNIS